MAIRNTSAARASLFSANTSQLRASIERGLAGRTGRSAAPGGVLGQTAVPRTSPGSALGGSDGHQLYLTLGSSTAYPTSASRFPTIVASVAMHA